LITKAFNYHSVHAFKALECELCKKPLSDKVEIRNQIVSLLDLQKPESNYIMLETYNKDRNDSKHIYVINMNEKRSIKLGRSNDSDIRLSDISISRNHALLVLQDGNFFLEDSGSKFGSLVQTTNRLVILPYKQLSLQIGRFSYNFNLKRTFCAHLSCYK
jgi:hypothetical protein